MAISGKSISVQTLLKRRSIDTAVWILQGLLIIFIFLCLVLIWREYIGSLVPSFISRLLGTEDVQGSSSISSLGVETEPSKEKIDYSPIASKSVFGSLSTAAPPPTTKAPPPVAQIALALVGTYVDSGEAPFAIIEDEKKKIQDVFSIGDSIFGQAKLVSVHSDRVEINRNGSIEVLVLDDSEESSTPEMKDGVAMAGADQFLVDEKELDKALENLPLLLTQARAVPYFEQGKAVGIRLFAIKTSSLFEKLGLQNGDILKSINGNSLADLSEAMKLFERLKQERSISVSVTRQGQARDLKYEIR